MRFSRERDREKEGGRVAMSVVHIFGKGFALRPQQDKGDSVKPGDRNASTASGERTGAL